MIDMLRKINLNIQKNLEISKRFRSIPKVISEIRRQQDNILIYFFPE